MAPPPGALPAGSAPVPCEDEGRAGGTVNGLITRSGAWSGERTRVSAYVVHCKHALYDVYGGRPGPLGNPFVIGTDGSRAEVITRFEEHLLSTPALLAMLPELRGKIIGCWCAPLPCHCEVLAWYANCWEGVSQMDKEAQLAALYAEYATSPVLQQVADGRRLVRGYGPLEAPLVVIGEAPGEQEDIQGRPFVGPSGRLLQELFARAELPWDLCYVMNVLPWRPPGNRTPYQFEIIASYPRVEREIDLIQPVLVVAAGSVAWHAVSQAELGAFTTARGHWMQVPWKDWMVLPVFHPSAILRAHGTERAQMEEQTIRALRSALAGADA
jgi:uracil-DNA glycosylase family 4